MSLFTQSDEDRPDIYTQFRDAKTHAPVTRATKHVSTNDSQSYDRELSTFIQDPRLRAEVAEYASRERHAKSDPLTAEELAQMREENLAEASEFRFYDQEELVDEKTRMGKKMRDVEFLALMNEIRPAGFVLGERETKKGTVYYVGLRVWVPTKRGGDWCFVSQIQPGVAPEYSIIRVDDHKVPLNHKYIGWRTVLLRAITKGAITEEEANAVFGEPTSGLPSRRYRSQLHAVRNRRHLQ